MSADDDPRDEMPDEPSIPHPDDRLWRHPSELSSTPLPSAASPSAPVQSEVRRFGVGHLMAAAGAGLLLASGLMWFLGPTKVEYRAAPNDPPTDGAVTSTSGLTVLTSVGEEQAGYEARLQTADDGRWSESSAVWLDRSGTLLVPAGDVMEADEVYVTGPDGERDIAEVVAIDATTGLATVASRARHDRPVEASRLVPEPDDVLWRADGSRAEVLATDQVVEIDGHLVADALIVEPGSGTGCGLLDTDGRLVAVVVTTGTDGAVALPAARALKVARDLRDHGTVTTGRAGIEVVDTAELGDGRVVVSHVEEGGAGDLAGVGVTDRVVSVDGDLVISARHFEAILATHEPGSTIAVVVADQAGLRTLTVTLTS